MQFKAFAIFAALTATQVSALGPSDIVDTIDKVTDLSRDATDAAMEVKNGNVLAAAPKLLGGFKDIVGTVTGAIPMLDEKPDDTFKKDDQLNICRAFTDFVKVHQNLLNLIIGESGLLSSTPFTAPIAAVLRVLEKGVDTLAYGIIGLVPTCADDAKMELSKLDDTIGDAVDEFTPKLPLIGNLLGKRRARQF